MLKAKPGKEIVIKVRNQIGVLAQLTRLVSDKGFNLLAISAGVEGENAIIHVVADDTQRVLDTLRAHNYNPHQTDVVLVEAPHKPGMLRRLTGALSDAGIDIHHLYASAAMDQDRCLIVFATANNDKAVVVFNQ